MLSPANRYCKNKDMRKSVLFLVLCFIVVGFVYKGLRSNKENQSPDTTTTTGKARDTYPDRQCKTSLRLDHTYWEDNYIDKEYIITTTKNGGFKFVFDLYSYTDSINQILIYGRIFKSDEWELIETEDAPYIKCKIRIKYLSEFLYYRQLKIVSDRGFEKVECKLFIE